MYHFLINIFIEKRSQSHALETVSLSKNDFFYQPKGSIEYFVTRVYHKQYG
jgi:hypothetical protein